MSDESYSSALARSEVLFDHEALATAIAGMAVEIDRDFDLGDTTCAGNERPLFLTLMHGGMIFAAHLAVALKLDIELDYLHATRYRGDTSGGALEWIRHPRASLQDRRVLLVDDILDEGRTLLAVRAHCLEEGARAVRVAVLCEKQHARRIPGIAADYCGVVVPDRYVFGFGMDYREHGRNLPGIHAL